MPRSLHLATAILLTAGLATFHAADPVGPFTFSGRVYDPVVQTLASIARDGTVDAATLVEGDADRGLIQVQSWSGDNQAGGRGVGGVNLFGAAGRNPFIGLRKDWAIQERSDGAGAPLPG